MPPVREFRILHQRPHAGRRPKGDDEADAATARRRGGNLVNWWSRGGSNS